MRTLRTLASIVVAAVTFGGCASGTLVARFGPLPGGHSLMTLVISEDLDVVRRECADVPALGRVLGCQSSRPVREHDEHATLRMVKIVRYAESLPSPATFEIDAHELCHVVAALQHIPDPCHEGNNGVLQAHGVRIAAPR